ncbi:hypothetical protein [Acinetobacter dispersus]|uniref:Uncharacterized protein n=1 Tax=Acinetobacter dispersus TaxID=70348 RepID=N9N376_9GAMM|nr:hypothetical protein [Acinetobacter dispersus]ENW97311.1 hypothetical protein F904_00149 [Acinetobacter dispersus]
MRTALIFLACIVVANIISMFFFGYKHEIAQFMIGYMVVYGAIVFASYNKWAGREIPKSIFYLLAGAGLSFCFYPLLSFYSLNPDGYTWKQVIGFEREYNFFSSQKWYGEWYGLVIFSLIVMLISWCAQQVFDSDN